MRKNSNVINLELPPFLYRKSNFFHSLDKNINNYISQISNAKTTINKIQTNLTLNKFYSNNAFSKHEKKIESPKILKHKKIKSEPNLLENSILYKSCQNKKIPEILKKIHDDKNQTNNNYFNKYLKTFNSNILKAPFHYESKEPEILNNYKLNSNLPSLDYKSNFIFIAPKNIDYKKRMIMSNYPFFPEQSMERTFIKQKIRIKNDNYLNNERSFETENNINRKIGILIKKREYYLENNNKFNNLSHQIYIKKKNTVNMFYELCKVSMEFIKNKKIEFLKNKEDHIHFHFYQKIMRKIKKKQLDNILLLEIFKNYFHIFRKKDKNILDRILIAFQINPLNEYSLVEWQSFKEFVKIIIKKKGNLNENVNFVMNFFTKSTNATYLDKNEFILILKALIDSFYQEKQYLNEIYELILENLEINHIFKEKYIDLPKLKTSFMNNKIDCQNFLSLICNID